MVNLLNTKNHNPTPSNSTVHSDFHHGVYFPGVLDYITIFKNSLHVFCFCKAVLQEQKRIQGYLVLTENIYPRQSEIGCYIPEFATTDHFLNERPCQTYKRQLKTTDR